MAELRPKLNEEAYRIVKIKEGLLTNQGTALPSSFSIVFMGDTHTGMSACDKPPFEKPLIKYGQLLNLIIQKDQNILAVVHGGDATHNGEDNLRRFIDKTWETLYTPYTEDSRKIPLFLNAGNHEYTLVKGDTGEIIHGDLSGYGSLVQADVLFQTNPPGQHNDVQVIPLNDLYLRVILLNTGYGNKGTFGTLDKGKFEREIEQLDKWMTYLEGVSNKIRFLIDMHIPPNIGRLGTKEKNPYGEIPHNLEPHVLNDKYNDLFTKYILDKHYQRLVAVVAHHRHCWTISPPQYPPVYYSSKYKLNFFLTPAGGNCDITCTGKCNPKCSSNYKYPYHVIKINFRYSNNILTIDNKNPYEIIHL